jgi:GntR family transcriptional regulator
MHMLNSRSPKPLYHQLADTLLNRTRTGVYPPGFRIPSENQLAVSYGIGQPTVRQAIDLLVLGGVLPRKRGSGTFVRAEQKKVDLFFPPAQNVIFSELYCRRVQFVFSQTIGGATDD